MATTTTPVYTGNTAGNIHASATLNAGATAAADLYDGSAVFETQVHVLWTSGTVAATNGLKVAVFRRYGATPTTGESAMLTYSLPSTSSTTQSFDFYLPTGKYAFVLTNLDATNAITAVSVTGDTVTSLSTA